MKAIHRYISRLQLLAIAAFCAFLALSILVVGASTDTPGGPSWASPSATALKQVGDAPAVQDTPTVDSNLDCDSLTYRLAGSSTTSTGCFTSTAYGLLDNDSDVAILNGSSEAVKLLGDVPQRVLLAWPQAGDLVSLIGAANGGEYLSLYTSIGQTDDSRDILGRVTAKRITRSPDLVIKDNTGQTLLINPSTLTFSSNGSWLVAEGLNGSFLRINLATLSVMAFAPSITVQGNPASFQSNVSISRDGRFVAIANSSIGSFKVYDLSACGSGLAGFATTTCASHEYVPFLESQNIATSGLEHVRFVNDGLLSFRSNGKQYELAPSASIPSLINYLGLGDSYTSGEGAFDYLAGTDSSQNNCHLSSHAYPLLISHDLYGETGGHGVACSGAVINDITDTNGGYIGQMSAGLSATKLEQNEPDFYNQVLSQYTPGYLAQQAFVEHYQPAVITVSVGGDDIGFGNIIQRCVEPSLSGYTSSQNCYGTYEDRQEVEQLIDQTTGRLERLYKQLHTEDPGARIYVIGYPQIAVDNGNCALNVHLSKLELEFSIELIQYLDHSIQQAANAAQVNYVDVSNALAGHRLCEAASYDTAVNGLTAGKDAGILGVNFLAKESYHPTALGQALLEESILRQTDNLQAGIPENSPAPATLMTPDIPKTGRTINNLTLDPTLTQPISRAGSLSTIAVDGAHFGIQPNGSYVIHIDGPTGVAVGVAVADDEGTIASSFTPPPNTSPGQHSIDVTGSNSSGEPIDISQPITIIQSPTDSDGDGIPDSQDSCPTVINSGHDSDQDGIDDSCDGYIAKPPAATSTTGSSTTTPTGPSSLTTESDQSSSPSQDSTVSVLQPTDDPSSASFTVGDVQQSSQLDTGSTLSAPLDGKQHLVVDSAKHLLYLTNHPHGAPYKKNLMTADSNIPNSNVFGLRNHRTRTIPRKWLGWLIDWCLVLAITLEVRWLGGLWPYTNNLVRSF